MTMLSYGIKFPLFIAGFSIIFKKLIRMNYISSALDVNMLTLPEQKHSIALMSFLLAYSMQKNVGIFHWKWSLLLLIRSLYSLVRLIIPKEYHVFNSQDQHTLLAPLMGCVFIGMYPESLPQSIKSTYAACYGFTQSKWVNNFSNHSRSLPSCCSTESFHEEIAGRREPNCFKAYWKDAFYVVCPHSFKFFMKLHFVAALLGGARFVKDIRSAPHTVALRIVRNALKSTLYWAFGVHAAVRCCTCFNRKFVRKLYEVMDRVMSTRVNEKYAYFNEKNLGSLFLMTAICGRLCVLAEPAGRRSEIVISLMWYEMVHIFRRRCGLETNDDDRYHWLLGETSFASILLATAVFVNMYVYCRDASYLKSMERRLIAKYLIA